MGQPGLSPTQAAGSRAEHYAAGILLRSGWIVLEYNFLVPRMGEIDLIARQGEDVVFVEVKARHSGLAADAAYGGARHAIGRRKRQRIERCTQVWLKRHPGVVWRPHLLAVLVEWDDNGQIIGYELRPF